MSKVNYKMGTLAVHAGQTPDPATGSRAVPIYQTTSYTFRSTEHAANLFALKELGNIYTRIMNPTTDVLEKRVVAMEGGTAGLAHSSGSAAVTNSILTLAGAGDHIVSVSQLYGGTYNLFHYTLPKLGIEVSFVDGENPQSFRQAVRPNTKAFEPAGGANVAFAMKSRLQLMRDTGNCASPMNSFLHLQGLETLHLRMERHCSNALAVAEYLKGHDKVNWVTYPGLAESPYKAMAEKYYHGGFGALVGFGVKGGMAAGRIIIENLKLFSHLANIGDAKSLAIHPASTTHSQLSEEEQAASGVTPDYIRLSVGIEDKEDIIADLDQAFSLI